MKTAGIVADNYKLEKFKKELIAKGFTDFIVAPYSEGVSSIQIQTLESKFVEIKRICQLVELHFKRSN